MENSHKIKKIFAEGMANNGIWDSGKVSVRLYTENSHLDKEIISKGMSHGGVAKFSACKHREFPESYGEIL